MSMQYSPPSLIGATSATASNPFLPPIKFARAAGGIMNYDYKSSKPKKQLKEMVKILLPENEVQKKIYNSFVTFLNKLENKDWPLFYLNWEMDLIQDLGFGFNLDPTNFVNIKEKDICNVKVDNIDYKIPAFIILKNFNNVKIQDVCNGLIFSRNLMENKFFLPNNLRLPYSRKILENKIL